MLYNPVNGVIGRRDDAFLGSYGLDSDMAEPESSLSEVLFLPANV
jgi:hypothetical protein